MCSALKDPSERVQPQHWQSCLRANDGCHLSYNQHKNTFTAKKFQWKYDTFTCYAVKCVARLFWDHFGHRGQSISMLRWSRKRPQINDPIILIRHNSELQRLALDKVTGLAHISPLTADHPYQNVVLSARFQTAPPIESYVINHSESCFIIRQWVCKNHPKSSISQIFINN